MKKTALALAALVFSALAHGQTVYSNNPGGDSFTNPGGPDIGQAIGTSGWYYNNVRPTATIGIDQTFARSGNGSAHFTSTSGTAKADIEFLPAAVDFNGNYYSNASLGTLGDLNSLSFDYYVKSGGTVAAHFHPVIRILVDADGNLATTSDRGGLVFEEVYNGVSSVATDTWVSKNITTSSKLWSFGGGMTFAQLGYGVTLGDWQASTPFSNGNGTSTVSASSAVIGFSLGIGSGWNGNFEGAVDNVAWQFNGGAPVSANFESVPEPCSMVLLGLGALAAFKKARRK